MICIHIRACWMQKEKEKKKQARGFIWIICIYRRGANIVPRCINSSYFMHTRTGRGLILESTSNQNTWPAGKEKEVGTYGVVRLMTKREANKRGMKKKGHGATCGGYGRPAS